MKKEQPPTNSGCSNLEKEGDNGFHVTDGKSGKMHSGVSAASVENLVSTSVQDGT